MREMIKPKKRLGQVFLKEKKILEIAAGNLGIIKKENVLEIGAGYGNLTEALLKEIREGKIFALEKDKELVEILRKEFGNNKKVSIIETDVRDIDLEEFIEKNKIRKVIGNIPYYLSGWLLRRILDFKNYPEIIILVLQREVGERIVSKKKNFLSVAFSFISRAEIIRIIKAGSFYPRPKVDSILIKLFFSKNQKSPEFRRRFFNFLRQSFKQPRKTLFSNLKMAGFRKEKIETVFENKNLDRKIRPHQLGLDDWLNLFQALGLGEKQ